MNAEELKATFDYGLDTHTLYHGVLCHMRCARAFLGRKKPDPETSIEYVVLAIAEMEKLKKHLEAWDQHRPISSRPSPHKKP